MPDNHFILMGAASDQGADLKKISGIAYTGGPLKQWWSDYPLVVKLDGLDLSAQIPLMYSHVNDPEYRLGVVTASIADNNLLISGGIDPDTRRGKMIIEAGKKCQWQLSIGAEREETQFIDADEKVTANGREFSGPIYLVTKSRLREVSVVALGADADTSMRIAAGLNNRHAQPQPNNKGENQMNEKLRAFITAKYKLADSLDDAAILAHLENVGTTIESMKVEMQAAAKSTPAPAAPQQPASLDNQIQAALMLERKRVADVKAALKDCPTMIDKAIECGWTADYCRELADNVKAAMQNLPKGNMNIIVKDKPEVNSSVLEAALELRAGVTEANIIQAHGDQIIEQASSLRGISLAEALLAACSMKGIQTGITMDSDTIRAGFASTDLPNIMSNVANKKMKQDFEAVPVIAKKLCSEGDLADYKESLRVTLSAVGDLEVVPTGGEVPQGSFDEGTYTNQVERFAKIFWLDDKLIINDDLDAFLKIPKMFGVKSARLIDDYFFTRLLSNPGNLFSETNKNYLHGSDSALSKESLEKARELFETQTDKHGKPISVFPRYLVVPSALHATAETLLTSTSIVTGEAKTMPSANIVSTWGLSAVSAPHLQAACYPGHSSTGWYLWGDPTQVDTFEIGYLRGQRFPVITRGAMDLNRFGIGFRVSFNFGVREQEHRGMVFSKGVA